MAALLPLSLLLTGAPSAAVAPTPSVTGPVTGGNGAVVLQGTAFDLASVGYTQSEFFLSGNATSYVPTVPLDSDGRWQVTLASTAPYTTRIVVNRPADPARFNGTVVVEWLNVSAGLDAAPEWIYTHNELIREGYAWVGVSAQAGGVAATETADPVRYADLSHPGDSYSYDVYSQAGQAVRDSAAMVLGGLHPRTVLANGESQSAFRLTTYINAIHPLVSVYDGFLIHSRSGTGAPLSQAPQADVPAPAVVRLRTDLDVPVLTVQAETDVIGLGSLAARQPDTARLRLWEVAGTAHADAYIGLGASDDGSGAAGLQGLNAMLSPPIRTGCDSPINTGQAHYVLDTAQYALNRWVTTGVPPARAARLEVDTSGSAPAFVLDAHGNVQGGVRTPSVDVPVATLSGLGQSGASFCFLFGTTTPFAAEKLTALYPSHGVFVAKWSGSAAKGVAQGFIRPADAAELMKAAANSGIGG
ncbi:alpha/beta hydrolase domain-containing protein [Streptomyces fulvoviolaceus]|uniref:alpha/beta hydrolase domain-containing protein n=1 Tax=Streptomyces fulvoviolaceus TaxID=285535 RepID=UPI0021BE55A6|nr:alpha/beta hydrolase domain-containing protein [Streptomyces fulvoviolaceus]MCT9082019.1 alpha/beta hydrolase domain-containing protein [Streptomyces fulvoviolaceus]